MENENTPVAVAPATPKTPKAKKAPKAAKKAPKTAKKTKSQVARGMADVPAPERKKKLVQALRAMGADSAASARPFADLVNRLKWTRFDVYGLVNGTSGEAGSSPTCLAKTGHVKLAKHEEGLSVYLTPKGKATKFDEAPFARG